MTSLEKAEAGLPLDRNDLTELLSLKEEPLLNRLYAAAYKVKTDFVGRRVYFRGLVELSNVCTKDCYYCGIRKSNRNVHRYQMTEDEIVEDVLLAWKDHFGSAVLQSGERSDEPFIAMIERVLRRVAEATNGELGITLSLGEQTEETFMRWKRAGAHRYLLRIEEADPEFYKKLHPADHSYEARRNCLLLLQKCGYQTGTGVMSGLPGQTAQHLANDLIFMRDMDIDMIGMGPYLPHPDTPLAALFPDFESRRMEQLTIGLKMIACARLLIPDANIASTTAMQTLHPRGREMGLLAGANVIMPNVGSAVRKQDYQLYTGKTGLDDSPESALTQLKAEIERIGETVALDVRGDPKHYFARTGSHQMNN